MPVNPAMRFFINDPIKPVLGIHAPPPRPTRAGAFWIACLAALVCAPVFIGLEIAWRVIAG